MRLLNIASNMIQKLFFESANFDVMKELAPNKIGVYIMKLNGEVIFVEKAIEIHAHQKISGLKKRLQEQWKGAANSTLEVFRHREQLKVTIKICETEAEAIALEKALIEQHQTIQHGWNLP